MNTKVAAGLGVAVVAGVGAFLALRSPAENGGAAPATTAAQAAATSAATSAPTGPARPVASAPVATAAAAAAPVAENAQPEAAAPAPEVPEPSNIPRFLGAPPASPTGVALGALELPRAEGSGDGGPGPVNYEGTSDPGTEIPGAEAYRRAFFTGIGERYEEMIPQIERCFAGRVPGQQTLEILISISDDPDSDSRTKTTVKEVKGTDVSAADSACIQNSFGGRPFPPGLRAFSGEEPRYKVDVPSAFEYFVTYRMVVSPQ